MKILITERQYELLTEGLKNLPSIININGVIRPTTNSNGKPIADTEEKIRNFYKWFGDSKVVDEQDRPLVMYHSTKRDFDVFKKKGQSNGFFFASHSGVDMHPRLWDEKRPYQDGSSIIPAYLSINNPMIVNNGTRDPQIENGWISYAKSKKHDGLLIMPGVLDTFVAFSPTQIKSVTGNLGDFLPNENNILK